MINKLQLRTHFHPMGWCGAFTSFWVFLDLAGVGQGGLIWWERAGELSFLMLHLKMKNQVKLVLGKWVSFVTITFL